MNDKLKKAEKIQGEVTDLLTAINKEERQASAEEREKLKAQQAEIDDLLEMAEIEEKSKRTNADMNTPVNDGTEMPDPQPESNKSIWGGAVNPDTGRNPIGFGNFMMAVKNAANGRNIDERLIKNTSGNMQSNIPDEGGFAIDSEFKGQLISEMIQTGIMVSQCTKDPVGEGKNGASWYDFDETSRATGSRMGGLRGYWGDEASSFTLSKPKLRKLELTLDKKLMGLALPTYEMMQDASFMGSKMYGWFKEEFSWLLDEAVYSGPGGGRPLGVLNADVTVEVAKEDGQEDDTITFENILKMYSRMMVSSMRNAKWYINQFALPQLATMGIVIGAGGVPVYLPASGVAGAPFGTLMGLPVQPIEQASKLGDKGDIVLGDFSKYQLIDKGDVKADSSIHVYFSTGEEAFRFIYRVDGRPMKDSSVTAADGSGNTISPFVTLADR